MKLYTHIFPDSKLRIRRRQQCRGAVLRCTDPECGSYPRYGGAGVTVCDEWLGSLHTFLSYLATLPGADNIALELDRIDATRGYEPGNVRFVTRVRNARNRAYTLRITYAGATLTLPDFREHHAPHVPYRKIQSLARNYKPTGEQILAHLASGRKRWKRG